MIDPIDFVESFKADFLAVNTDDLAKKKLRVFVKSFLDTLSTAYKYVEKESNDYDILFDLQSVDGKRQACRQRIVAIYSNSGKSCIH
jgi:hypothetical protein